MSATYVIDKMYVVTCVLKDSESNRSRDRQADGQRERKREGESVREKERERERERENEGGAAGGRKRESARAYIRSVSLPPNTHSSARICPA